MRTLSGDKVLLVRHHVQWNQSAHVKWNSSAQHNNRTRFSHLHHQLDSVVTWLQHHTCSRKTGGVVRLHKTVQRVNPHGDTVRPLQQVVSIVAYDASCHQSILPTFIHSPGAERVRERSAKGVGGRGSFWVDDDCLRFLTVHCWLLFWRFVSLWWNDSFKTSVPGKQKMTCCSRCWVKDLQV